MSWLQKNFKLDLPNYSKLLIISINIPAKPMSTSVDMLKSCGFFVSGGWK